MVFESFLSFLGRVFCFSAYIKNADSFPGPLREEEEREYLEKAAAGDEKARDLLIRHNLRLVAHVVKKYSGAGEADDLISVGSIGLIKGIRTYKSGKGSRLATYAARCIENEILMYIRANKKHRCNVSLSESVGSDKDGNDITLIDVLSVPVETVTDCVENKLMMDKVRECVATLPPRERIIITLRYGMNGDEPLTQLQVAKKLNISRSYVSRIEKRVLSEIASRLTER